MSFPETPNFDPSSIYIPPPPGVHEYNLNDEWRGVWEYSEEFPEDVPVNKVYVLLLMNRRGYVVRQSEDEPWNLLEAAPNEDESLDALLTRMLQEQAGATLKRAVNIGYLDCKATSHNEQHPAGTRVIQPMVVAIAADVADQRPGAAFMRRRLPANEYIALLRKRYPDLQTYIGEAMNRYLVINDRGEE